VSFVGRDSAGSFGILPKAFRRITVLSCGLAQFRTDDHGLEYLALSDGVLSFKNNELFLAVKKYYRSQDFGEISRLLEEQLKAENTQITEIRRSVTRLDQEIISKMQQIGLRLT
jgi:F-type H+-transporting ATPase subunit epsilon